MGYIKKGLIALGLTFALAYNASADDIAKHMVFREKAPTAIKVTDEQISGKYLSKISKKQFSVKKTLHETEGDNVLSTHLDKLPDDGYFRYNLEDKHKPFFIRQGNSSDPIADYLRSVGITERETMGDHIRSLPKSKFEDDGFFRSLASSRKSSTSLESTYSTTPVTIGYGMIDSPLSTEPEDGFFRSLATSMRSTPATEVETIGDYILSLPTTTEEDDGFFKALAASRTTRTTTMSTEMTAPVTIGYGMIDSPISTEEDDGYFKSLANFGKTTKPIISTFPTKPVTMGYGMIDSPLSTEPEDGFFRSLRASIKSTSARKVKTKDNQTTIIPKVQDKDLDALLYKY